MKLENTIIYKCDKCGKMSESPFYWLEIIKEKDINNSQLCTDCKSRLFDTLENWFVLLGIHAKYNKRHEKIESIERIVVEIEEVVSVPVSCDAGFHDSADKALFISV